MPRETSLNPYEGNLNIPEAEVHERALFEAINNTNSPLKQGNQPTLIGGYLYDRQQTNELLARQGDRVREGVRSLNGFIGTGEIAEGYWFSQPESRDTSVRWALGKSIKTLSVEESMLMANPLLDGREGNKVIVSAQAENQAKAKALLTRIQNTDCDYTIENQDNPEADIKSSVEKILNFDTYGGNYPLPEGFDYKINTNTNTIEVFYNDENFLKREGTRVLVKYSTNASGEIQVDAAAIKVANAKGSEKIFYVDTHDKYSVTTIIGVLKRKDLSEDGGTNTRETEEVYRLKDENKRLDQQLYEERTRVEELSTRNERLQQMYDNAERIRRNREGENKSLQQQIGSLTREIQQEKQKNLKEQQRKLLEPVISLDLSEIPQTDKNYLSERGVIQQGSNNERILLELQRMISFLEVSNIDTTPEYTSLSGMLENITRQKSKGGEITLDQRREILNYLMKLRTKYKNQFDL